MMTEEQAQLNELIESFENVDDDHKVVVSAQIEALVYEVDECNTTIARVTARLIAIAA